jgi:hypothetical protein
VLGLLHFETASKACFRKLARDEEALRHAKRDVVKALSKFNTEEDSASEASTGSLGLKRRSLGLKRRSLGLKRRSLGLKRRSLGLKRRSL